METVQANNKHTLIINNKIEELEILSRTIQYLCDLWNIPKDIEFNLNLVLEELLSNTIFYGYKGLSLNNEEQKIRIDFKLFPTNLMITLQDNGIEFNPLEAPEVNIEEDIDERPIGGLGIHLVKTLIDKMEYKRSDAQNHITLIKNLN